MTTVFVAGATGRLGRLVVDRLRQRDVQVRALVRPGNAETPALREEIIRTTLLDLKRR